VHCVRVDVALDGALQLDYISRTGLRRQLDVHRQLRNAELVEGGWVVVEVSGSLHPDGFINELVLGFTYNSSRLNIRNGPERREYSKARELVSEEDNPCSEAVVSALLAQLQVLLADLGVDVLLDTAGDYDVDNFGVASVVYIP